MSELIPTHQADEIRRGLVDFLRTTFALSDADVSETLAEFLENRENGIFKGPFLRLRMPFEPASDGWRDSLDWHGDFTPYSHQAAAFERLSSLGLDASRPRPLPTLVTTGTGSGKTESFLYPIIDHVLRAKNAGVTGTKALILYPMNALANDQAGRLAKLLAGHPELGGITAAIYTGQKGPQRTVVSEAGLITDRSVIRSSAPDILLTNYKMLDQMLLREADARIWKDSAHSLQYLVLDEFHTYDGAQGTDVSMLLRRLGLAIKSYWDDSDSYLIDEVRERPLGRITPVATSATLGGKGDPTAMLEFAKTVFGEEFPPDSVVTESRLPFDVWAADAGRPIEFGPDTVDLTLSRLGELDGEGITGEAIAAIVVNAMTEGPGATSAPEQLEILKRVRLTRQLAERAHDAVPLIDLVRLVPGDNSNAEQFLLAYVAALGHVRAVVGREALSVDLHLWVRELTRIDRGVSLSPAFFWSDDGLMDEDETVTLPAIYCRHCGRSGWGVVLTPVGEVLDEPTGGIRRAHAIGSDRFRPLIFAQGEGARFRQGEEVEGFRWLLARDGRLGTSAPADEASIREGRVLPVLTHVGDDAGEKSKNDTCPLCQRKDSIRFLGSAIATMLSVSMSTIFGTPGLDNHEKKALVFTDSVQDAAHRAGFIQARSHSLTLRSIIREAVGDNPVALDQVVERMIERAGDDKHRRFRLLPPDIADTRQFREFWEKDSLAAVPPKVLGRVRKRLRLNAELEFGLQLRVGRTLELTGSLSSHVDVPEGTLISTANQVLDEAAQDTLVEPVRDRAALLGWTRGVLMRMRERGAIEHEWFRRYQSEDGNRYSIWGGRQRSEGMPAFPRGRAAPGYPRVGGKKLEREGDLDPVVPKKSWYAEWTAKNLQVGSAEAGVLATALLERLAKLDVLSVVNSDSGARIFQLRPSSIVITPIDGAALEQGAHFLECSVCQWVVPGSIETINQLDGRPCTIARCNGTLARVGREADNFYRRLYANSDIRRVVSREHTSQLDDKVRLKFEDGFKSSGEDPEAPNVLVATPTLEMGIDIGDLSTVMLASLPRSVASYLQRVGRAGRLTGNALNLAFITGRGDQLPRLGDPLSVINGEVSPPATYIDADEIIRRQYMASVADRMARDPNAPHPIRATEAMNATDAKGYLRTLISRAEENAEQYLDEFLAGFPSLGAAPANALRTWATPEGERGSSGMAQRIFAEAHRWAHTVQQLQHRLKEIQDAIPELKQRADSPAASDEDKQAARTADAAQKLARRQIGEIRGEHWVSVLEEHGILPNYTLFDDSVSLDVSFSWIDPDTGEFENEPESFHRAAALALREFAPGATFYGRGHQIKVDAVELGIDNAGIVEWVYCPECGYSRALSEGQPGSCPRCCSKAFADVRQRVETVEMTRVSSAMRREEAAIDDSTDERIREPFSIITSADVDEAKVASQWFAVGRGFGVRHLRGMQIRWTNIGRKVTQGNAREIGGKEVPAPLFRVCAHCGQLDQSTLNNRPSEHRPWCPQRRKHEEDTRSIALTRTLITEGLVVRLPPKVGLDDSYAIHSIGAALMLGLRERIGGAPDHIAIESIVDPVPAENEHNYDALLLHDIVPGGTGYLADLSKADEFWAILRLAWEKVRDCECANENRLACHRCILPFARRGYEDLVSRVTAERHLHDILMGYENEESQVPREMGWELTKVAESLFDPETKIEQLFRKVLTDRLDAAGAKVKELPGSTGNRLVISANNGRQWKLEPQVNLGPAKPDFVLEGPGVPRVAIFCDGWLYHASPDRNRLADDARKRAILTAEGNIVLGITWSDLEAASDGIPAEQPWFDRGAAMEIKGNSAAQWTNRNVEVLQGGVIDFLINWIQAPDEASVTKVADWLPWVTASKSRRVEIADSTPIVDVAKMALRGELTNGESSTWVWHFDTVALAARQIGEAAYNLEVALLIDDDRAALGPERKDAWNAWLSLSNVLALRSMPTTIATMSSAISDDGAVVVDEVSGTWSELLAGATDAEQELIRQLGQHDLPLPVLGDESDGGIPLSFAWPDKRLAIGLDLDDDERAELLAEGWQLVDAAEAISRLSAGGGA